MKKILVIAMVIFLSACSLGMSSPKQIVSEFLDKYKNQDETVLSQLDQTVNSEYTNDDYRSRYKNLMTNQYKNLDYKIKDEVVEGDNAVVEVEITVYDYASAIRNSNDYLNSNTDEFKKDSQVNDAADTNGGLLGDYDEDKFIDYKLTQMENISDTVNYNIEFTLTKVDGKWQLDSLSNSDIEKIHGIYNS